MSGHTPGPWTVVEHGYPTSYHVHAFVEGPDRAPICGLWMPAEQTDIVLEGRANARLIAAAPDLLALCEEALSDYGHPSFTDRHGMADRLRAAIAKVEGR